MFLPKKNCVFLVTKTSFARVIKAIKWLKVLQIN